MYQAIKDGKYEIAPPHTAQIPKDNGEFRTVYVNEPMDRILLSIANDLLFELTPEMIHSRCKSYQKGTGCGKIVQEVSKEICETKGEIIGWKSDLSKYFDSVPIRFIDGAFDMVEQKYGHSALIDVLRKYYHSDYFFDPKGNLLQMYQSLKQGCAVASWLADVLLYHIDEKLTNTDGFYVRYSDDMLAKADIVASCLPDTPETYHIYDAARFAAMKKGAYFVNVGRGTNVDQAALQEAVAQGHLAGAALDVTDPEPLPSSDPLWKTPGIYITPHISGGYHLQATHDYIVRIAADNLKRYRDGAPRA